MKYYAVKHTEHEAYPTIRAGEMTWYDTPHDLKYSYEEAVRQMNYILDVCDDPILDDELMIVEVERDEILL